jgi:HEPN domain-containing protein
MNARTQEWLDFAKADLLNCERILDDEFLTSIVTFHSQQAVEKCFKALIEENNLPVPRIHSLLRLYEITSKFLKLSIGEQELLVIDEIYTRSRYPGEIALIPTGKPSLEDAKGFYEIARKIYDNVTKQLE